MKSTTWDTLTIVGALFLGTAIVQPAVKRIRGLQYVGPCWLHQSKTSDTGNCWRLIPRHGYSTTGVKRIRGLQFIGPWILQKSYTIFVPITSVLVKGTKIIPFQRPGRGYSL
jgi:hypothetical protein